MRQKGAGEMANSVDLDQTVCSGLSVQKLRIITVYCKHGKTRLNLLNSFLCRSCTPCTPVILLSLYGPVWNTGGYNFFSITALLKAPSVCVVGGGGGGGGAGLLMIIAQI